VAARSGSFRPALEALEHRTLLSAGALDLTFGGSGKVITHVGIGTPSLEGARAMAIDQQGNIVVAGTAKIGNDYDFAVLRYHPDGTPDTSFGNNGKRTIDVDGSGHDDGAYGVAIDSKGRIVLAGYANNGTEDDFAVVRLNANGSLDGTFNGTGIEVTAVAVPSPGSSAAYAVTVDASDRIVAAGYAKIGNDDDFAVVRYNTDGSLDTTFGGSGKRTVDMDGAGFDDKVYGVAIDSQGRIVLAGQVNNGIDSDIGIARLTTTGALDGTFNNGTGKIITHVGNVSPSFDAAHGVAIDPQGNLVVAGTSKLGTDYDFTVLRFTAAGNPDGTFGNSGKRTIDVAGNGHDDGAYGVAIDWHGRIDLAGYASDGSTNSVAFARLLSDGSTDSTFGNAGKFVTSASSTGGNNQAYGMAADAFGRVVAAGYAANATDSDFATLRLTDNTVSFNDNTGGNQLTLQRVQSAGVDNIQLLRNGTVIDSRPTSSVTSYAITDSAGNDTLTVKYDASGGSFNFPVTFHGDTANGVTDTFQFEAGNLPLHTQPGVVTAVGLQPVYYTNVGQLSFQNTSGIDTFYGPDTKDRSTALAGLSANERFVQALYLDALGRAGSKAELDGWVTILNASGQAAVAKGIEHSLEASDHLVKSWYVTFLGRQAQGGEEMGWSNALAMGDPAPEELLLSKFLVTPEFFARAQTMGFAGSANDQFIQALYHVVLNRAGISSEVAGWETFLATSDTRQVALEFLESQEYRGDLIDAYYDVLLHRPADPVGFNSQFNSDLGYFQLRVGLESSSEFFMNG
jgi:uncharacterized delta-60 repeat protein